MDLHSIAQYLSIADVVRNDNQPRLNRWQYWGTSLTNASVFEMPGKFIHEAFTEKPNDLIVGAYNWMVENHQLHYLVRRAGIAFYDQDHLMYQRLVCPLEGPSKKIDHLLVSLYFHHAQNIISCPSIPQTKGLILLKYQP